MKAVSSQSLEKYSAYKRNLVDEDSGSDDQPQQISKILCELIPAYYQYRKYLVDILRQANASSSIISTYAYPSNYYEERIKKCQQQQKLNNAKITQRGSGRLSRTLVTQKIIQKKRKQLEQHRQLMRKYQAQQIQELIGTNFSQKQLLPKFQQKIDEQPTFEAKNFRRRSSIDYNIQPASSSQNVKNNINNINNINNANSANNANSGNRLSKQSPKNKKLQNTQNVYRSPRNKSTIKQVQQYVEIPSKKTKTQSDFSNSINQSKVIQKSRNNNLKPIETQSFYEDEAKQKAKLRKMSQSKGKQPTRSRFLNENREKSKNKLQNCSINEQIDEPTPLPKIRINYQSQKQELYEDQLDSQDQQAFLNVQENKIINNANIVQVEHENDDTYSQYKAKPYTRQNTPNFDVFSQQVRPRNFFQGQKQKLLKQKQQADLLNNEVSGVLGEGTQSFELNEKQIIRQSKQNFVLDQLLIDDLQSRQIRNGKLSPRQSIQFFLSSIRYLLCELCDLNAHSQCHKYLLKNKQYQILMNLCSEQVGKGPIFAKVLAKKIQSLLKYQQKSQIDIVLNKIFNSQAYISFQDFGQAFYTKLTKNQYSILSAVFSKINPYQIEDLLGKLFSIWLQINYFQNKLRKLFQTNSSQIDSLNQKITSDGNILNYEALQKFVYTTSHNRLNSLKIQLFFSKIIPSNTFNEMKQWLELKKVLK